MAKKEWKTLLDKANENLQKYDVQLVVDGCDENGYSLDIKWTGKLVMTEEYACGYYEHELADLINEAWAHVLAKVDDPNLAKPVAVPMEKPKVTVIFGEIAAKHYCSGGVEEMADYMDVGQLTVREFDTEAERRAYIMGIDDADGWLGAAILSKEDAECETVKQLLDK